MAKVLLVEDDADLANTVRTTLLFEHHQVELIESGSDADIQLKTFDYDLIILDWGLPGKTGIEICRDFRSAGKKTPILLLTGKDSIADKEIGLDAGADDYLTKPFDMRELSARVRALLRRAAQVTENVLVAGDIALDTIKYRVSKLNNPVDLQPKEFQLLEFFMRHPNQVFSAEALLARVWPSDSEATTEALRTTLKRLRRKVDPDGTLIRTVHGVGYVLEHSR